MAWTLAWLVNLCVEMSIYKKKVRCTKGNRSPRKIAKVSTKIGGTHLSWYEHNFLAISRSWVDYDHFTSDTVFAISESAHSERLNAWQTVNIYGSCSKPAISITHRTSFPTGPANEYRQHWEARETEETKDSEQRSTASVQTTETDADAWRDEREERLAK